MVKNKRKLGKYISKDIWEFEETGERAEVGAWNRQHQRRSLSFSIGMKIDIRFGKEGRKWNIYYKNNF